MQALPLSLIMSLSLIMTICVRAQTTPSSHLEQRDGLWYAIGAETPFTGDVEDAGMTAGRIEQGYRVGRWTGWHENGQIAWVSDYQEGRQTYHAMYDPTGATRFEGTYRRGVPDGVFSIWSEDGVLTAETHYSAGERDGIYKLWDERGRLLYSAVYAEGKLHGPAIWWFEDGRKRWETSYVEGKRDGAWTQWQRDGQLLMQSEWKNGDLIARNNPHLHH